MRPNTGATKDTVHCITYGYMTIPSEAFVAGGPFGVNYFISLLTYFCQLMPSQCKSNQQINWLDQTFEQKISIC